MAVMGNPMADRTPKPSPTRRLPRWAKIAIIVILALAAIILAPQVYVRYRIRQELDAIRKAGYPVTLEELDRWIPAPTGANAADVYQQAFAKFARTPGDANLPIVGTARLPELGEPLPEEMQEAIADYLKANADALALLHKAAGIPECQFPSSVSAGSFAARPELTSIRQAARLLYLEALARAEAGDAPGAAQSVEDMLAMSASLRQDPTMISRLVRVAVNAIAMVTLERVLSRTPVTDQTLRSLAERQMRSEDLEGLPAILAAERCTGYDFLSRQDISQLTLYAGVTSRRLTLLQFLYRFGGAKTPDLLEFLRLSREWVTASQEPLPQRMDASKALASKVAKLPEYRIGTKALLSISDRFLLEDARGVARLRCARAAMAVERYRNAKGTLPETLESLVPEYLDAVPQDPFNGKPLLYKRLEKRYVVYSVNDDGKDDGGNPLTGGGNDDVTFTVAR
jgi:hypothetical protein